MRKAAIAAGVVLLIGIATACSTPVARSYRDAAALVRDLQRDGHSCSGLASAPQPHEHDPNVGPRMHLVRDQGTCELDGARIDLFVFANETKRDDWLQLARRFGSNLVVGPDWAVMTTDAAAAETVVSALAGERESSS